MLWWKIAFTQVLFFKTIFILKLNYLYFYLPYFKEKHCIFYIHYKSFTAITIYLTFKMILNRKRDELRKYKGLY